MEDWNAKVGSQETPGVTGKFGLGMQNEAGKILLEFCQENSLVIANTLFQQHNRRLYTWTLPDGQHQNQIDYILCSQRWRSSLLSTKTRPGADCGPDHEHLFAFLHLFLGGSLDPCLHYNVMDYIHSSSDTLSIRSNSLNLFFTSTV